MASPLASAGMNESFQVLQGTAPADTSSTQRPVSSDDSNRMPSYQKHGCRALFNHSGSLIFPATTYKPPPQGYRTCIVFCVWRFGQFRVRDEAMAPSTKCNDYAHPRAVLSLRTLEFWVDNLNPDYLYPEMSRQTSLFTELMTALSRHLRPAPYPYGS
jgi:hypothetical protein